MGISINDMMGPRLFQTFTALTGANVLQNIRLLHMFGYTDQSSDPQFNEIYIYNASTLPADTPGSPDLKLVMGRELFLGTVQPGFYSFEPGGIRLANVSYRMLGAPTAATRMLCLVYLND